MMLPPMWAFLGLFGALGYIEVGLRFLRAHRDRVGRLNAFHVLAATLWPLFFGAVLARVLAGWRA